VVMLIAGLVFFSSGLLYAPYLMFKKSYRGVASSS
jgi:hypothetical protein